MASGLDVDLQKLRLTEEETEILDFDDPEEESINTQIALCLVGKLYTNNHFNPEAFKSTMKNVWKPAKGVFITDLEKNLFSFQFFCQADKEAVLNDGPWAFDGNILLLRQMDGNEQPSEMQFTCARFWIKVKDLPMKKKTHAIAEQLGSKLGTYIDVEEEDILTPSKYLRLRVDVNITKALQRGLRIMVDGKPKWIEFRYVKLPDFCYACGMIGHVYRGCPLYDDLTPESELIYGPKLRGSPLKKKRRGGEIEWEEERKKLLELRGGGSGSRVMGRLTSHETKNTEAGDKYTSASKESREPTDMFLDGEGCESSKRKLADFKRKDMLERKIRLVDGSQPPVTISEVAEVAGRPREE